MRRLGMAMVAVLGLLAACTTPKAEPASSPPAPKQPVPVTFDVPEGFARTTNYRILVPLHQLRETQWVVPAGTFGLDVIAVTSYVLDEDVTTATDDRLVARIAGYADQVSAASATEPTKTSVAASPAFPAFQQTITQPSSSGPLTYDATFVFAGPFLVQVICQYDQQRDVIHEACGTVLETLRITFV